MCVCEKRVGRGGEGKGGCEGRLGDDAAPLLE